ncbi:MAG: prolyl oligopeptidase family serine peptidase [Candidatus Krumholzibacteriota bacterium]
MRLSGIFLIVVTFICCAIAAWSADDLVIRNVTIIDVTDRGTAASDIEDAVIVITDGVITAAGPAGEIDLPPGAVVLDAQGGFAVPGLIDCFAALNHQAHADAYLAMGVTTIVGVESTRRGPLDRDSDPSPDIRLLGEVGYEAAPLPDLLASVEAEKARGVDVLLVMYRVDPSQMPAVVKRAHELGMPVIGELARTKYVDAAAMGVDAFVHTTRYSLGLASEELRQGIDDEPFSDDLDSPKWRYYQILRDLALDTEAVRAYGSEIARNGTALIPTLSLGYLDRPGHANPWDGPVAAILDERDIHWPADKETGEHTYAPDKAEAYRTIAQAEILLDSGYFAAGCTYLAGSGADVWGTMPGISLHHELEALVAVGHSPRQALAAATSNPAEVFGWNEIGAVAPGKRADLVLLGSDPRVDVGNLKDIHQTVLAGRVLDRAELMIPKPLDDGQLIDRRPMAIPAELLEPGGSPLAEYAFLDSVDIDEIVYISDGLRVAGHIITPKTPGPHPCLIYNRGGNREFGANSPRRVALRLARFASWGYVVVASQYRGNGGGTEGIEEFGGAEVADVLNLIPLLESLDKEADADRIGMTGFSRGGLMTYLALAGTDRLRAAAIVAGVSDSRLTIADRPDMETFVYAELVPDYWNVKEEAMSARSPVEWPEKLCPTTPILLLHGTADWRVHPTGSMRMAEALFELRRPYRFIMYEGADHGLSEFRAEAYGEIRHWLDRYVRDKEELPDLEPHGP